MADDAVRVRARAMFSRLRRVSRQLAFSGLAAALTTGVAGWFLRTAGLLVVSALFAVGAEAAERAAKSRTPARTVGDVMTSPVVTIPAAASLVEVEQQFLAAWPYRVFPVLRGEHPVGLLQRQDVLRTPVLERVRLSAQAVMTRLRPGMVVRSTDSLETTLMRLDKHTGCAVVIDDGQLRGLLTSSARDP